MQVTYGIHLVIFGVNLNPPVKFDISKIYNNRSRDDIFVYRGTISSRRGAYTVKITRNGYCTIYLKKNFSEYLSNIKQLALDVYDYIKEYCKSEVTSLFIYPKNIQITFQIILKNKLNFKDFCFCIVERFPDKYDYEVKESNSSDSVWLSYTKDSRYFSSFRLKNKEGSKCIYTFSYTYNGSCLTSDIVQFTRICDDIRMCYMDKIHGSSFR